MSSFNPPGMGWRRDTPDFRDYTCERSPARELWGALSKGPRQRPAEVDLRDFFWPVEDQGQRNCSTACACLGLVEYFELRSHGHTPRASRLFLYKTTHRLQGIRGDGGADLRTTFKALVRFGVPPEQYETPQRQPRDLPGSDPFLYGFAADYQGIHYVRLDPPHLSGEETLAAVKACLAAGFPSVFGFPVPSSISTSGYIPYRPTFDSVVGGQAVLAVGYDDRKRAATKGALLIRNSWGSTWGEDGYGWLPYTFVEERLAVDFWTLLGKHWLESGEFSRPAVPLGASRATGPRT